MEQIGQGVFSFVIELSPTTLKINQCYKFIMSANVAFVFGQFSTSNASGLFCSELLRMMQ